MLECPDFFSNTMFLGAAQMSVQNVFLFHPTIQAGCTNVTYRQKDGQTALYGSNSQHRCMPPKYAVSKKMLSTELNAV